MPQGVKPELLVQPDAHGVGRVDAAYQDVVVLLFGGLDDGLEQRASHALAAKTRIHVDRMLDGVLVGRPFAELAIAGEAQQFARVVFDADDRIVLARLALEPGHHVGGVRSW